MTGRHRSPPPPTLRPGWRWHTVAALAGLGILAPPVWLWAEAVAPDATAAGVHGARVSTVTRAERTTAGPLEVPTVGVVAPAVESLYPTPSASPQHTATGPRGTRRPQNAPEAVQSDSVAILESSEPTVTPAPQPVTTTTADAPPPTTAAATSSATEEPAVTLPAATPTLAPRRTGKSR